MNLWRPVLHDRRDVADAGAVGVSFPTRDAHLDDGAFEQLGLIGQDASDLADVERLGHVQLRPC